MSGTGRRWVDVSVSVYEWNREEVGRCECECVWDREEVGRCECGCV